MTEEVSQNRNKNKKRLKHIGCGVLVFLFIVVVLVTAFGGKILHSTAERILTSALGVPVRIGDLRVSLMGRPSASVVNLTVGEKLLTVQQASVTLNTLGGDDTIVNLSAGGIRVNVPQNPWSENSEAYIVAKKLFSEKSDKEWALPSAELRDLQVTVPDAETVYTFSSESLSIKGLASTGLIETYPNINVKAGSLALKAGTKDLFKFDQLVCGIAGDMSEKISINSCKAGSVELEDEFRGTDSGLANFANYLSRLAAEAPAEIFAESDTEESTATKTDNSASLKITGNDIELASLRVKLSFNDAKALGAPYANLQTDVTGVSLPEFSFGDDTSVSGLKVASASINTYHNTAGTVSFKTTGSSVTFFPGETGTENFSVSVDSVNVLTNKDTRQDSIEATKLSFSPGTNNLGSGGVGSFKAYLNLRAGYGPVLIERLEENLNVWSGVFGIDLQKSKDAPVTVAEKTSENLDVVAPDIDQDVAGPLYPVTKDATESLATTLLNSLDCRQVSINAFDEQDGSSIAALNCEHLLLSQAGLDGDMVKVGRAALSGFSFSTPLGQGVNLTLAGAGVEKLFLSPEGLEPVSFNVDKALLKCPASSEDPAIMLDSASAALERADANQIDIKSLYLDQLNFRLSLLPSNIIAEEKLLQTVFDKLMVYLPADNKNTEEKISETTADTNIKISAAGFVVTNMRGRLLDYTSAKSGGNLTVSFSSLDGKDALLSADSIRLPEVNLSSGAIDCYGSGMAGGTASLDEMKLRDFAWPNSDSIPLRSSCTLSGFSFSSRTPGAMPFVDLASASVLLSGLEPISVDKIILSGLNTRIFRQNGSWDMFKDLARCAENASGWLDFIYPDEPSKTTSYSYGDTNADKPFSMEVGSLELADSSFLFQAPPADKSAGLVSLRLQPGNVVLTEFGYTASDTATQNSRLRLNSFRTSLPKLELMPAQGPGVLATSDVVHLTGLDTDKLEKGPSQTGYQALDFIVNNARLSALDASGQTTKVFAFLGDFSVNVAQATQQWALIKSAEWKNPRLVTTLDKEANFDLIAYTNGVLSVIDSLVPASTAEEETSSGYPLLIAEANLVNAGIILDDYLSSSTEEPNRYFLKDFKIKAASIGWRLRNRGTLEFSGSITGTDLTDKSAIVEGLFSDISLPYGIETAGFTGSAAVRELPAALISAPARVFGVGIAANDGTMTVEMAQGACVTGKLNFPVNLELNDINPRMVGKANPVVTGENKGVMGGIASGPFRILAGVSKIFGSLFLNAVIEGPIRIAPVGTVSGTIMDPSFDLDRNQILKAMKAYYEGLEDRVKNIAKQPVRILEKPLEKIIGKDITIPGISKEKTTEEDSGTEDTDTKKDKKQQRKEFILDVLEGVINKNSKESSETTTPEAEEEKARPNIFDFLEQVN